MRFILVYFGRPKIENIKTDFRKKAKPKIGSMDNVAHIAGGGQKKVFLSILKINCFKTVTKVIIVLCFIIVIVQHYL